MEFREIKDSCWYFNSAVNIGYVRNGEKGMLIDAGLDQSTAKKVLKKLKQEELPLTHLFITHAHADHFGGAAFLQAQNDLYTMAPPLEEAILRYPVLEPMYLFQGNEPLPELRNKFLEGSPIRIDQVIDEGIHTVDGFSFECLILPGHSAYQAALLINDVLYAADSYFSTENLHKHKIPYITDAKKTIESLERVKSVSCKGAVPGHGVYEENFHETVQANIAYHLHIIESLRKILRTYENGCSQETIVRALCREWKVKIPHLSSWALFRTAVTAYVAYLFYAGEADITVHDYTLWVQLK
ncbi:MBL fold metallo-hydrolase [Bacillus tianshenii]|nr:MBL fold metallo-hydrolase [Bacillus tianshenii]